MYRYKTKGDTELVIPGVGVTVGGIIESPVELENPNLELITVGEKTAEQPSPAHVAGVAPQTVQPPVVAPLQINQPAPAPITPVAESEQV